MQTLKHLTRQFKSQLVNNTLKIQGHKQNIGVFFTHVKRSFSSSNYNLEKNKPTTVEDFELLYALTREKFLSKKLPKDVNARGVFACNELDLSEVNVYGFDYDYTLACYKPCLHDLLYNLGRDMLIKKLKYTSNRSKPKPDTSTEKK